MDSSGVSIGCLGSVVVISGVGGFFGVGVVSVSVCGLLGVFRYFVADGLLSAFSPVSVAEFWGRDFGWVRCRLSFIIVFVEGRQDAKCKCIVFSWSRV